MCVCLQTKMLCYHSMGNVNGMAEMITLLGNVITENAFTTKSSCVYLNMFAYCQITFGHHKQSVNSILQSLRIFPSRYNSASGYLKIVLHILNSLSIRLFVKDYIRGCTTSTKYWSPSTSWRLCQSMYYFYQIRNTFNKIMSQVDNCTTLKLPSHFVY
jgi:hypothetical protein